MPRHTRPIDERPFQPKAQLENRTSLEDQYRQIAIDDVVAALHHMKAADGRGEPEGSPSA